MTNSFPVIFLIMALGCSAKASDNSYLQMNVTCPKEGGFITTPMTIECKCQEPQSSKKDGLMSVLGGVIGFAAETLTD